MVSDEELNALVEDSPEKGGVDPEVLLDRELKGLISDLSHHRSSVGHKLIDLYGGDVEAALKFTRQLRNY